MLTPDIHQRKLMVDKMDTKKLAMHKKGDYGLKEMLPQSVDWETEGGITEIDDQGMVRRLPSAYTGLSSRRRPSQTALRGVLRVQCAGSYAFAAASAMETAVFIASGMKKNSVPRLSRQQLLDCDHGTTSSADQGCRGGIPDYAYGWTAVHGGICAEAEYPYLSANGLRYTCRQLSCTPVTGIRGYKNVMPRDEDALQDAVAQQPVTVGVSAGMPVFQLYKDGVFDHPLSSSMALDHAMVVIGYGTTKQGINYWKLKNSWGTTWGQEGFMLMKRGVNMAGIAIMPSYPIGVGDPTKIAAEEAANAKPVPNAPPKQPTAYDGACHAPQEGDVKLSSYPSGNVLLWYDGEWHTVCNEKTNPAFANLVCKMLGFSRAEFVGDLTAAKSYSMVSSPHCLGSESSVIDCRFDAVYKNDFCSTYRNMLAMYLTCADGEMSNYTMHCGYKSPGRERLSLAARWGAQLTSPFPPHAMGARPCSAHPAARGSGHRDRRRRDPPRVYGPCGGRCRRRSARRRRICSLAPACRASGRSSSMSLNTVARERRSSLHPGGPLHKTLWAQLFTSFMHALGSTVATPRTPAICFERPVGAGGWGQGTSASGRSESPASGPARPGSGWRPGPGAPPGDGSAR